MRRFYMSAVLLAAAIAVAYMNIPPPALAQSRGGDVVCSEFVKVSGNTAVTTQLVAAATGKRVYVCAFVLTGGGATTAKLVSADTGGSCANPVDITGALELGDNTAVPYTGGTGVLRTPDAKALCWVNSGAVQVSGVVSYGQF